MRGGAQSQLMLGADGNLWVVKFQNNPQHLRVLANELIVSRLAEAAELSVPRSDIIEVTPWLAKNSIDLVIDVGRSRKACTPGLQFGSRFVGGLVPGETVDYLPEPQLEEVLNRKEFTGMLVLDKWTGNCNGRQAVFNRRPRGKRYTAAFIDQGFCFNAGDWTFPDSPLRGVYARNSVYAQVSGWDHFSPWLEKFEEMDINVLANIAEVVPPEWYGGDMEDIERLMEQLLKRRSRIREFILSFRNSERAPFPLWTPSTSVVVPLNFMEPVASKDYIM
jgi:hypothetical protein